MPKTFPIMLEVEELLLGPVLRKLHEMPGIAKLHLDLGHGGQGAGRKRLTDEVTRVRSGGNHEQIVIKLLMEGPQSIADISRAIGGKKPRAYGVIHALKKKGITESAEGKGMHQLTAKARAQLGGSVPALPAPQVKHGPAGRAAPGSGNIVLRSVLAAGPMSPADLRKHAAEKGMSAKSITGVLDRAKKNGLIKKNARGYELTAKGQKIELGVAAHA
jgi:DNA-binding PadR family transcriptional regulator